MDNSPQPPQPAHQPPQPRGFLTLQEFLQEAGISYSTYRTLRAQGRMPAEIRLSRRTIRISRDAIKAWRHDTEESTSQQSQI